MRSILERIESHLSAGNTSAAFTFYSDDIGNRRVMSLSVLHREALEIARTLPRSSPVLIMQPDPFEFITSFFGCLYAGATAVPLALPTRRHGIEQVYGRTKAVNAQYCLTNSEVVAKIRRWYGDALFKKGLTWICTDAPIQADSPRPPILPGPSDIALVQFTSGSTGVPKAIAVTHENIVENSKLIQGCFRNGPNSVSVCWLPSYHDMGLIDGIIQPLYSGFHCVLMSPTSFLQRPVRWLRAMSEFSASYSGGPNFAFDHCIERVTDQELFDVDLSALDCLYNGSERVSKATLQRFTDRFSKVGFSMDKFVPCYGLAEATLAVTASAVGGGPLSVRGNRDELAVGRFQYDDDGVDLVSCGKALGDTELRILDQSTQVELPPGEIGEICVSGCSIAREYRDEWRHECFVRLHGKRFLRTGDLGFVMDGDLFVTGRIKDVIIIRGRNHDPAEIERASFTSHRALTANSAAAFSVFGDKAERLVVIQEIRRTYARTKAFPDVIDSIVGGISETHGIVPYEVTLISPGTLPKTSSGKVQRSRCKEMWAANKLEILESRRWRAASQNA